MRVLKHSVVGCFLLPGFSALTVGKYICLSEWTPPKKITEDFINHEAIHFYQQREMFYLFFFVFYFLEWIFRALTQKEAYRNISFEREAYKNQKNLLYLSSRKKYAWLHYLR